jgi:hypothetical protein
MTSEFARPVAVVPHIRVRQEKREGAVPSPLNVAE